MRRTHLRGHTNILKRLLIHAGGCNLGLVLRHLRQRYAARAAGSPGDRYRYAFIAPGRYSPLAPHSFRIAANDGCCTPS
jgi:hypothetical protein